MKREKLLTGVCAFALASLLAVGGVGCLTTAFGLAFSGSMLRNILLLCALFSLWQSLPRGKWLCAAALALTLGYFWRKWDLPLQLESLMWHISGYYDSAYGCGTVSWSGQNLSGVPRDNVLTAIGGLVGLITAATVCGGGSAIPALAVSILPLAACVVVTDTVPESQSLYLLMLGFFLLLMTQSLRRRLKAGGNCLTALLAAPVALALALLFLLIPRESYTPPSGDLSERIIAWFENLSTGENLGTLVSDVFTGQEQDGQRVDLQAVGPQIKQRNAVMEVTAARDGTLYLRGQAYDIYDGKSWSKSEGVWVEDGDFPRDGNVGTIHVVTNTAHDVFYMPYNMGSTYSDRIKQGMIRNPNGNQDYYMDQWEPEDPENILIYMPSSFQSATGSIDQKKMAQYLQLPETTREQALDYLHEELDFDENDEIWQDSSDTIQWLGVMTGYPALELYGHYIELADAIADRVRTSASYSLRTRRMPAGEEDFAMWFLNESDTGYCVHFATAAAVLLRAAGIPARYVTGYLVDGVRGESVTVRGGDAHAWVEYWLPGIGWRVLEATASGETSPVATAPTPTQTTDPQPENTTSPGETKPEQTRPDATRPSTPAGDGEQDPEPEEPVDLSGLWRIVKWVLAAAAAIALLFGQRLARLRWREVRRRRGSSNEQALYRWRETEGMCRALKQEPPEALRELARKAKFSQHQVSPGELAQFDAFRADAVARLKGKSWYGQLLYRLVLALY